ncbi:MAG: hypothetical protein MjAS7_0641 [Metallosphaera javensis (ex Sakai et al. 2022)]|nr:MAG: hypothetical protein MjAS7_0641 [Metallosphaera javensis (ex Sakai et al. 2022)]
MSAKTAIPSNTEKMKIFVSGLLLILLKDIRVVSHNDLVRYRKAVVIPIPERYSKKIRGSAGPSIMVKRETILREKSMLGIKESRIRGKKTPSRNTRIESVRIPFKPPRIG